MYFPNGSSWLLDMITIYVKHFTLQYVELWKMTHCSLKSCWYRNKCFWNIKVAAVFDFIQSYLIWDKVFKKGPNKVCGRQPLKNLKGYGLNKQTISL